MNTFHIDYDEEGDILDVRWGPRRLASTTAVELNDNIILYSDYDMNVLIGLTLLSYRCLIQAASIELTNLQTMPLKVQQKVHALIRKEPLSRFMRVQNKKVKMRGDSIKLTSRGPILTLSPTMRREQEVSIT